MKPLDHTLLSVYLKPGEMHIAQKPTLVTTVLGSCVSVTMFHRVSGVGAICHELLPQCKGKKDCDDGCVDGFKYMNCSIQRMIERFKTLKVGLGDIEVKIFGGADVLSPADTASNTINVGKENIETALREIEREGLRLVTYDVGGTFGRKILFYTHTGEVLLKRLKTTDRRRSRF